MTLRPTAEGVLELARRLRVVLTCRGSRLKFSGPAAAVAELKPLLLEHKWALLALLSSPDASARPLPPAGNESWDQREALRLMAEADALVERLGVDGLHPVVADAATVVGSAFAARDLATVRFACSQFAAMVRELAHLRQLTPWH